MFPRPRIVFLVALERVGARHEQAPSTVRTQARINLVEFARTGLCRQEMREPPHETTEEEAIVERLIAIGNLFAATGIMQEHDIEIGTVGEFEPPELAIADNAKARLAPDTIYFVARHAMARCKVEPRSTKRLLEYRFGEPRQAIADLHDRQTPIEVRDGDAKHRRTLELSNRTHSLLGVFAFAVQSFPQLA